MDTVISHKRTHLLTWLIVPVLLAWVSVTYMIGLNRAVSWVMPVEGEKLPPSEQLVSAMMPDVSERDPLVWESEPLVTFWFDDAWESQFTEGFRILEENNYVGALAVPTRLVEFDTYMTWPQVKQVQYKGWEITSHTRNHICDINKYKQDTFTRDELVGALEDFQVHGMMPSQFVTPCGISEEKIFDYARQHYGSLRGTGQGVNPLPIPEEYLYNLRVRAVRNTTTREDVKQWIAEAEKENAWLIIMFHQIDSSKKEYVATPEMAEAIVDEVKKSGIKVVLPSQVINMKIKEEQENE